MLNPIKRLYKPHVISRSVNLGVVPDGATAPSAACEVTEYDCISGMEQWNESVFLRDFEAAVLTVPAPLYVDSQPANHQTFDDFDPFASVGKPSA